MLKTIALSTALFLGTTIASLAQEFGDWFATSGNDACWALTLPTDTEGGSPERATAQLSIQNDPSQGVKGSIIATNGTIDATEMRAVFDVDGKKFDTLTYRDTAFVASGKPEAELIAAMTRGSKFLVYWNDKDGNTITTDTYSLDGFSKSKEQIDALCKR